ncbi:MAG: hypothetical protein RL732_1100 [Bacteroidota bacterium]|jgi:hypothetical protein
MIHIVFNTADIEVLQKAMELDEKLQGDILEIKDEWGVGPLKELDTEEGWKARQDWWRQLLEGTPYGVEVVGSFDDREKVRTVSARLEEFPEEQVWIWMGQNQHDVTGYFWLLPQLRAYQGRVMVLYLNNLPFINEKGQLFYPLWISEIMPREAVKAQKLARAVTLSEFEVDPDEWKRLAEENAMVRILEGGKKIVSKEEHFYDQELIKNITGEWQKVWRIVSNTLHRMKIKTGDVFLYWRLRKLVEEGKVVVNGDLSKGWKDVELKFQEARQMELSENTPA